DLRGRNRDNRGDNSAVQLAGQFEAAGLESAHDLRNGRGRMVRIAWVLALGAEGQEEFLAHVQTSGFEERQYIVARRSGISSALEDDELSGAQTGRDRAGRI